MWEMILSIHLIGASANFIFSWLKIYYPVFSAARLKAILEQDYERLESVAWKYNIIGTIIANLMAWPILAVLSIWNIEAVKQGLFEQVTTR